MALKRRSTVRRPSLGVRKLGFKKAVTKIAKRVVNTQAETKTGSLAGTANFGTTGNLINVFGSMSQGTGQNQRVGDSVRSLGFRMRALVCQDPGVITANQDANVIRMLIVVGKRPLVLADFGNWKDGIDPELMTIVSDTYFNFATTKRYRYINKYIKFNRKLVWDPAGNLAKNNIYIYTVGFGGTGLLAGSGDQINYDLQRFYKDS